MWAAARYCTRALLPLSDCCSRPKQPPLTMLRGGPASLLLRLAQRAPLARVALPLLAAYAPEAFSLRGARARGLHVFARAGAHEDFCKVEVRDGADAGDLKKAVIAELQLGARAQRAAAVAI